MKSSMFNGNVIDFEASGLGAASYPIEVGVVLGNGATYESLIAPAADWTHWDASAQALHGISRADLLRWGKPIEQVAAELNELCSGKVFYSDCWVLDSPWLNLLFSTARCPLQFRLSPIEAVVSDHNLRDWGHLKQSYSRYAQIRPHRALNDAIIIGETLERLSVGNARGGRSLPMAAIA